MKLRLLPFVALVAACGQGAKTPPPAAAGPAAPQVVDINAVDYAFQAPDTIAGGWVTFRLHNNGKELHHAALFRLTEGKTFADLAAIDPAGAPPAWLVAAGGAQAPVPAATMESTVRLEAGSYVLACVIPSADGKPHLVKGMVKPITVTAPAEPAATPPPADITVTLSDFAFDFSPGLTAGKHTVRVVTAPGQPHEVVIARLVPGKKAEDFLAWAEKPAGPPPVEFIAGGATPLGAGGENVFPIDLTPGDYAVICFLPDAKDGKLHAVHGMMKTITIS